jgi:uncharacterized protein YndB with AHSA1/START domain
MGRVKVLPIDLAIETPAGPAEAWRSITDPARVALWFTDVSSLGPVGSRYRLEFGDGSVVTGEVLELEPGRRFSHGWRWEHDDPAEATVVTWTVEPLAGGRSRIRLVHAGWDTTADGSAARDEHEAYWSGYLDDLRDILDEA